MRNYKVLVVAPSRRARGGITALIKTYEGTLLWKKWNCRWVETYRDSNSAVKILYFLKAFFSYLTLLPQCKIVHVHLGWSTSAIRKLPFLLVAFILRKETIVHLHSGADRIIEGKYQFVYRFIFSHSNCIVVLANLIKDQLIKNYTLKKIEVLYNPCPDVTNEHKTSKTKTILFAATLSKNKGYLDLITAFSEISHNHLDWITIFAGNGEIEKGLSLSKKLGIHHQVVFTGWISGKEKDKLFQEASIFCLPSYNEGFPMAVLDAFAYGLPVITTPVGGLPDVMIDGYNGLIFTPGDISTLSDKILELICNEELRNKLSKASVNLSKNEFSLKKITMQLDQIYNNLVS